MSFKKCLFLLGVIWLPMAIQAQNRPAPIMEPAFAPVPYYSDADGDGYGNPAIVVFSSTGAPAGYVSDNTDCNPNSAAQYRLGAFYVDADNDTFYDGNPFPSQICYGLTTPTGYVAMIVGSDCDDTQFEVNSNHVEVLGNGVDDNCDGNIDEIGPYAALAPAFCGNVLPRVGSEIYATTPMGATGWRFRVILGATVNTFDSDVNHFNLNDLPIAPTYLANYSVQISVRTNGFWRAYAPTCTVSTPRAPIVTTLLPHQCGMTMTNMGNIMYCYQNSTATMYRYELSDGIHPARTYDSTVNRFVMPNFVGGGEYAVTYSLRIALFINGVWEDWGPTCLITTPPEPPLSSIIPSQCGITISNAWTTIYTIPVLEAEAYRFEVTNGSSIRYYSTTMSRFALPNLSGAATMTNTAYTIRVAIMYHGAYLAYGPACTITTASVLTRQAAPKESNAVFNIKAAPNPFSDHFGLAVEADTKSPVSISIYDVFGRMTDHKILNVSESGAIELGNDYASGVYTIVVKQHEEERILRVVKR